MSTFTLPYDPTGLNPTNLISTPEIHNVEPSAADPTAYMIVPRFAPFYAGDFLTTPFEIYDHITNRKLNFGDEYYFTHRFVDASYKNDADIFGSITFRNLPTMPSIVRIQKYQSMGGNWTLDSTGLLEFLANTEYNPRIASWEQVVDPPEEVPVRQHGHNAETDTGSYFAYIAALGSIAEALRYITGENLPSLEQLGIGNIRNYPVAELDDLAGAGNAETYVTAQLLVTAINLALSDLIIPGLGTANNQAYPGHLGEANRLAAEQNGLNITTLQQQIIAVNNALNVVNYSVPMFADVGLPETAFGKPNISAPVRTTATADSIVMRRSTGDILTETVSNEPKSAVNVGYLTQVLDALSGDDGIPTVVLQQLQNRMNVVETTLSEQETWNDATDTVLQNLALAISGINDSLASLTQRVTNMEATPLLLRQMLGDISGAVAVNVVNGLNVIARIVQNTTFTINLPSHYDPLIHSCIVNMRLTMAATYTVNFPTGTIFPNGIAPNLESGKSYLITLIKEGNANWRMTEPVPWNS